MRLGLTGRLVIATGVLTLLVAGAFGVLLQSVRGEREASRLSRQSQEILVAANELERLVIDLETGHRGFVLTGEERFLEPWIGAQAAVPDAGRKIERLTEVPAQSGRAERIVEAVGSYVRDYSVPLVEAARRGEPAARGVEATERGKQLIDDLRDDFDRFLTAERVLAASRQDDADDATRTAILAATVGLAGSVALCIFFGGYLTQAIVRPVRRASTMAVRLAGGELSARMSETSAGELGDLERSFNTMANSLETSHHDLAQLLEQQASLRRVATLVAHGLSPAEVFDAVVAEVSQLHRTDSTRLLRYEADGTTTVVAARSEPGIEIAVGTTLTLEGDNIPASVLRTGRPARMDSLEGAAGSAAALLRDLGLRSAVGAPVVVDRRLWGVMVAAWTKETAASAAAEERIAEFTELVGTAIANADSRAELSASRARVVAAADETRRRIERDLHDGTQQRLVSLGLELRALEAELPPEADSVRGQLSHTAEGLAGVVEELQEISRGIHPAILSRGGLTPALKTLARRSALPVELRVDVESRLPQPLEVAAYYVVSEALTNAAKHAQASVVDVEVEMCDGSVRLSIHDDGTGGADPRKGSGLIGLRDRVESLGGTIDVTSSANRGTTLIVVIPIDAD